MAARQPKAEKLIIKIKPQRALPPLVDDKVDKLLALPLSATDVVSDLLTSQVKILGGTSHAESIQSQRSECDTIDLDDDAEESCEEREFMVMNEDPYEPQGGEVEEYWPSDRKETPENGPEITFINLNPSLFSTSGEQKEPECGPTSHSEDESFLQKLSKKRVRVTQRGLKQRKKMRAQANLSEDDDDSVTDPHADGPRQFTVYVQVWTASPDSRKPGGKSAKVSTTNIISRGPFKCDTAAAFPSFKSRAAKALSCRVSALPVSKFEWKFENQAQGAPRKKVADETGYEALLDAVKAKRRHENVVDSDMGEMDNSQPVNLDCELRDFNSKASLDDMVSRVKPAQAQLEQTYPLGGCPLFPDRRVWHNKTNNTYFELTQIRIKYWAANIVSGKCDISAPPVSAHFADSNKLKVPTHPPHIRDQSDTVGVQAPSQPGMMPLQPHVPMGPFNPYYLAPYMHSLYNLPYGNMPYPAPPFHQASVAAVHTQPPATHLSRTASATSSSPGRTMAHNVTLSEFCGRYHISNADQEKLEILEYLPGNCAVEKLDDHEWRVVGKFSRLGWEVFLVAHRKFCRAIKAGTWL
ncbi:hypothetical protein EDC04DRAFT_2911601 [Pisolithus marmoratus]|nr:hypothetical protein EDC04DRAFT_2911601 [Pisolithus marmoratus]